MTSVTERLWPRLEWVALFLAAPVIWYAHFWGVYLLAEAGCFVARRTAETQPVWLIAAILLSTVAAVALILWTTWLAWRKWRRMDGTPQPYASLYYMGFILGPLFAVATLFIGLPAAYLPPC